MSETLMIFLAAVFVIGIAFAAFYLHNPFRFPYAYLTFDATNRRNPQIEDFLDTYLNAHGLDWFHDKEVSIETWERDQKFKAQSMLFSRHRLQQLESVTDSRPFVLILQRTHTRYRQQNYQRYAYSVQDEAGRMKCSYNWIKDRYQQLETTGHECTLKQYHTKNQRNLMTPALRKQIMERDHYTCQMCGKYMPDGVGLQIDHIIPVAKGGKTVPSNLQVLCSKCNGKKKDKLIHQNRK